MEQDVQLSAYRQRLIEELREQAARRPREGPSSLRIFVNGECLGMLDLFGEQSSTLALTLTQRIEFFEIRSDAGLALYGIWPEALGVKRFSVSVGKWLLEGHIDQADERGRVKVAARPNPSAYRRLGSAITAPFRALTSVRSGKPIFVQPSMSLLRSYMPQVAILSQGILALAVVFFLIMGRTVEQPGTTRIVSPQQEAKLQPTSADQEKRFLALAQAQQAMIDKLKEQQEKESRSNRALTDLMRAQQQLKVYLDDVAQHIETLENVKLAEDRIMAELGSATIERQRMRDQIQQLTSATAALNKNLAMAEAHSRSLEESLKPKPGNQLTASEKREGIGAEKLPPTEADVGKDKLPLTFWVAFHDGTPEKSIEELIQEIHGRSGPINSGWHNVEVHLPKPQTPDIFFDSLKKAKIVKAITTNLNAPSAGESNPRPPER